MGTAAYRLGVFAGLFALLFFLFPASVPQAAAAQGAELQRLEPVTNLTRAVRASQRGDVILVAEGRHDITDLKIPHDLTLIGEGEAVLYSSRQVAKGLLVPLAGTDITVRGLTFEGAISPDQNGAGIRFEGSRLIVEDCTFRRNENGILATGDTSGSLAVRRSTFIENGHGDGYSHGMYQAAGQQLEVTDSRFVGTKVGHHVKTLVPRVNVEGNSFDDADGETSYVVDATGGGVVFITGNTIHRRRSASQSTLFNYSTTRGGELGSVHISGNRIINEKWRLNLLRNPEKAPAEVFDNEVVKAAFENDGPRYGQAAPLVRKAGFGLFGLLLERPAPFPAGEASSPAEDERPFTLRRLTSESGYVTYGEVFAPGEVRGGSGLAAAYKGGSLPLQMDVKARHADGSVRHAVLTLSVPAGRGDLTGRYEPERPASEALPWGDAFAGLRLQVTPLDTGPALTKEVELAVGDALAGGEDWLAGPIVREKLAAAPVGKLLTLRLSGRQYGNGQARLRLSFENHASFSKLPRDLAYRVRLVRGDDVLFEEAIPLHYRNAGWTAVVPLGFTPAAARVPDPVRLAASGAFPPLDRRQTLLREKEKGPDGDVRPGDHEPVTQYMPMTGGRDDIGPVTHWAAAWALRGEPEDRAMMLRAADIGLTVPWHFGDDETGLPARADKRPDFWAEERGVFRGRNGLPAVLFEGETGGWETDLAHKPSLAYPAYLATGEAVYARALAHEAAYGVTGGWPALRGEDGLLVTSYPQLRAIAWSLRDIGDAAFLLPDDDPMKDYFIKVRDRNISELYRRYVVDGAFREAGALEGYFQSDPNDPTIEIAPWQNDFIVMVLAREVVRGSPRAREVLNWAVNFTTGRVLNIDDPSLYAGLVMKVGTLDGDRARVWADAAAATRAAYDDPGYYPGDAGGGVAMLRAALSAVLYATDDPRAAAALTKLRRDVGAEKMDWLCAETNYNGCRYSAQFNLSPAP